MRTKWPNIFFLQDNKWGKLKFQMEKVVESFNFLKDEGFEKVGLSSWVKFPVEKETYFGPDIFQVARACLQNSKWGKLEFQMEMVEKCFTFRRNDTWGK